MSYEEMTSYDELVSAMVYNRKPIGSKKQQPLRNMVSLPLHSMGAGTFSHVKSTILCKALLTIIFIFLCCIWVLHPLLYQA